MHKRLFQSLKRTLKHVSGLPLPDFDFKKSITFQIVFFLIQNIVGEDLRLA